jgi:DNA end-binding protein Ku
MASVWKGSISFGLVNIPVELQGAVTEHRPRFRLLHAKDKSPVSYERVCQREGKNVAWQDLVKGYEYSKGKFVVLTKEDFETAAIEKTKTIDILDFVDDEEVDERFFDNSYYALPGKGSGRGYVVLREAIRASGRIGIGKFVLRDSEHLVALHVVEDALVLTMMRFADELVDVSKFQFPRAKDVRPKELQLAKMLIDNLEAKWDPEKYKDEYRENLMRVIKAKMKGVEPDLEAEEHPKDASVIDLMERLRRSLEGGAKGAKKAAKRKTGRGRGKQRKAA